MSNTDNAQYETSDIGLVAFLKASGCLLADFRKEPNSYKIRFYFENYEDTRQKALAYYRDQSECNVNARSYMHELDDVRNIMYSSIR